MQTNKKNCTFLNSFDCHFNIKIIGEKDADGFYWGECGGRSGYVPCNMVSEVQVDDERVARELLKVGSYIVICDRMNSFVVAGRPAHERGSGRVAGWGQVCSMLFFHYNHSIFFFYCFYYTFL